MNLQSTKMELIEMLVSTQKVALLKKVKTILEEDLIQLTPEDYKIIDARRERHFSNQSKSFSWEETKQVTQKR